MLRKVRDLVRTHDDSGFSLVEVIVALAIFLIASSAMAASWLTISRVQLNSQMSDIATKYANGVIEKARASQWERLGYSAQTVGDAALQLRHNNNRPVLLSPAVASTVVPPRAVDRLDCLGMSTGTLIPVDEFNCGPRSGSDNFKSRVEIEWVNVGTGNLTAETGFDAGTYGTKRITVSVFWPNTYRNGKENSRGWCMDKTNHRVFKVVNDVCQDAALTKPDRGQDNIDFGSAIVMSSTRTPTTNEVVPDGIVTEEMFTP